MDWVLGGDRRLHRGIASRSMDLGWVTWTLCGAESLRPLSGDEELELFQAMMPACPECEALERDGVRSPPPPQPPAARASKPLPLPYPGYDDF